MSSSFLHWLLQLFWHSSSQESFAGFIAFIIAGAPKAISFVAFSSVALFSAPKIAKKDKLANCGIFGEFIIKNFKAILEFAREF